MAASRLRRRWLGRLGVSVVGGLVFVGRDVLELAVQPAVGERVDQGMSVMQRAGEERAAAADGFGLEQPDSGFRQGVVVGIADAAD